MKATVYLSDGGALAFEDFDAESALDLREELQGDLQFLAFEMDDDTVLVNRDHIVRVDFE